MVNAAPGQVTITTRGCAWRVRAAVDQLARMFWRRQAAHHAIL